ncbi:hypothetical protein D3C77_579790 [compost metagenome]
MPAAAGVSAAIAPPANDEKAMASAASLRLFIVLPPEDEGWSPHQRLGTVLAIRKVVRWLFRYGYSDRKIFLRAARKNGLLPYDGRPYVRPVFRH